MFKLHVKLKNGNGLCILTTEYDARNIVTKMYLVYLCKCILVKTKKCTENQENWEIVFITKMNV